MDTVSRFSEAAKLRAEVIKEERKKRALQRSRRVQSRSKPYSRGTDDNDTESKLRSVFAAIRSHTNSDVELSTAMAPSELFHAVIQALSCPSAMAGASETRSLGEALDLVSRLNAVLQAR